MHFVVLLDREARSLLPVDGAVQGLEEAVLIFTVLDFAKHHRAHEAVGTLDHRQGAELVVPVFREAQENVGLARVGFIHPNLGALARDLDHIAGACGFEHTFAVGVAAQQDRVVDVDRRGALFLAGRALVGLARRLQVEHVALRGHLADSCIREHGAEVRGLRTLARLHAPDEVLACTAWMEAELSDRLVPGRVEVGQARDEQVQMRIATHLDRCNLQTRTGRIVEVNPLWHRALLSEKSAHPLGCPGIRGPGCGLFRKNQGETGFVRIRRGLAVPSTRQAPSRPFSRGG